MSQFSSLIARLTEGVSHIEITRYSQLSSSSIIIYDHLITLEQEIELVWKAPWSKGKVLFILNRYYSLASVIFNNYGFFSPTLTPSFCLRFFQWQGWTGLIACVLAEVILQMRLYAMYSLNKAVLALMIVSFVASTATSGWIMHTVLAGITTKTVSLPNGSFCVPVGVPDNFYTFWIPMLVFECLLCTLALVRGFQAFRADGSLFRAGRDLVRILIRDSVLYFLVICSTYLSCLLVWIIAPVSLLEVPIGFSVAMSCVLANRIILNVRVVNRDLELSKLPVSNEVKDITFSDSYLNVEQDKSFGNCGTLTQYEMDELRMMRPAAPEPGKMVNRDDDDLYLPFVVL
ncbi:hypothetical protein FA15DRAFT_670925 [Coprinopsis marcescibilis]|uniref:DUF6533 domain-containing protein n=1 Tax=Coprinopsis marcescibilis TaxID=230819 RepID=A0A5C3KRW7_COPMA|nr:hypothetical protein FA15DRAFT_670925 [Coprinopsis marcescibilis]